MFILYEVHALHAMMHLHLSHSVNLQIPTTLFPGVFLVGTGNSAALGLIDNLLVCIRLLMTANVHADAASGPGCTICVQCCFLDFTRQ